MSHRHFCDHAGHDWQCDGSGKHPVAETSEQTTQCMCFRHGVSMEDGDHSKCPVELLACPEHREEQIREVEQALTTETHVEETDVTEWDALCRPMTSAERAMSDAMHVYMDQMVFIGLEDLNTGFDSPAIRHFSPVHFGEVINRCEPLHISPIGIEIFTTDGGFVDCEIRPEDLSLEEVYNWALQVIERYLEVPKITMTATFDVPDSLIEPNCPSAVNDGELH